MRPSVASGAADRGWRRHGPGRPARLAALLAVASIGTTAPCTAGDLDIDYGRFATVTERAAGGLDVTLDQAGYEAVLGDLARALAPRHRGPAAALGGLGFQLTADLGITDIDQGSAAWTRAADAPPDVLLTAGLHLRKGLPYSFELGGAITHLFDSRQWAVSLEIGYAPVSGFRDAPDLGFRLHVGTVFGGGDATFLLAGADAILSKDFGLDGAVTLRPYAGYSFLFAHASSHPLPVFSPRAGCDPAAGGACSAVALFADANLFIHRGALGLDLLFTWVTVGFEALVGDRTQSYTTHVGVDF